MDEEVVEEDETARLNPLAFLLPRCRKNPPMLRMFLLKLAIRKVAKVVQGHQFSGF